jgi:hypothetical protein
VFTVQKALLCNSSTYFKAALNGPFVEGQSQTIDLDDEDPSIFRTYVAWLYQGQLRSRDIEEELDDPQDFGLHIAEVIVFADKRDVGELKNDAISMLLSYLEDAEPASLDVINCIYNMPKSAEINGLRQLLADAEVYAVDRLNGNIDHWHPESLANIIKIFMRLDPDIYSDCWFSDRTRFCKLTHKHATNAPRCLSLVNNWYEWSAAPAPAQGPPNKPNKKRRTMPSTQTVEVLDD